VPVVSVVVVTAGAAFRGSNPNVVVAPGVRPGPKGVVVPGVVAGGPNPNGSAGGGVPVPGVVPVPDGVPPGWFVPDPVPLPLPFPFCDPLPLVPEVDSVPVPLVVPEVPSVAAWFAELIPVLPGPLVVPVVPPEPVVPVPLPNPPNPVPVWPDATCVQTHPARRVWSKGRANVIAKFVG